MITRTQKIFDEECLIADIQALGGYFEITFESNNISNSILPGQFVNVKLKIPLIRRPFTLFDKADGKFSILVKVVGVGTEELSKMKIGQSLRILGPLGNSVFDFGLQKEDSIDLVAGGVGIANMLIVAKYLRSKSRKIRLFWGVRTKDEYFEKDFEYFDEIYISSDDGSIGEKGFITQVFERHYKGGVVYACGPIPMLSALSRLPKLDANRTILSLETFMGCGIGICYGCNVKTRDDGYILVCKEGPNILLRDILV